MKRKPELSVELRRRYGLPEEPPPPYDPVDAEALVKAAVRDMNRRVRRRTIATMIPIVAIQAALYLLGVNGVVLALVPLVLAYASVAITQWSDKQTP